MKKNYLDQILASKKRRLTTDQLRISLSEMEALAFSCLSDPKDLPPQRFYELLGKEKQEPFDLTLIAEIKQKSPSKGLLRSNFDPGELATAYHHSKVDAISVITEIDHFSGHPDHLVQVRKITATPLLRKDFIISAYDVLLSKVLGADALLLIAAALTKPELTRYIELASELGLESLVEVHDETDTDKALCCGARLIGINNRDLTSFKINLDTTERLAPQIPKNLRIVSESGILTHMDLERVYHAGAHGVLCGEVFMTSPDIHEAVRRFRSPLEGRPRYA